MQTPWIYLDHAATTPLHPEVAHVIHQVSLTQPGNPSSLHGLGQEARQTLQQAQQQVASHLQVQPEDLIWTSGGTEANNLALWGFAQRIAKQRVPNAPSFEAALSQLHFISSSVEHEAVKAPMEALQQLGAQVTFLPVSPEGWVTLEALQAALQPNTVLVSLIHAQNEVGSVQDLDALGFLLRERGILFHSDCVQSLGKRPFSLADRPVDAISVSAHKVYGPRGLGFLYVRPGVSKPQAQLLGGGQQRGLRSGTLNTPAIVGFAKALDLLLAAAPEEAQRLQGLAQAWWQDLLYCCSEQGLEPPVLNGPPLDHPQRLPGLLNFSLPGSLRSDQWVNQLSLRHIAVSSGSACSSTSLEPSPVVLAMGKSAYLAERALRVSMGRKTTAEQLALLSEQLLRLLKKSQKVKASAGI